MCYAVGMMLLYRILLMKRYFQIQFFAHPGEPIFKLLDRNLSGNLYLDFHKIKRGPGFRRGGPPRGKAFYIDIVVGQVSADLEYDSGLVNALYLD